MPDFLLPDLGEGLSEGEILTWHVSVGDEITVDQVVVEVETAKAAVEVPAPLAGIVTALHGAPGDTLEVGTALLSTAEPAAGDSEGTPTGLSEPRVVGPEQSSQDSGSGNVLVGYGTSSTSRRGRRRRNGRAPTITSTPAESRPGENQASAVISPLVRERARRSGLSLDHVKGTGPNGIVRRADVEAAIASDSSAELDPAGVSKTQEPIPDNSTEDEEAGGDRRVPLRGLRKTVADKLSTSRREIPEATVWVDADATDLVTTRRMLNEHPTEHRVSLLALIARFTVAALRKYPELNSQVDGDSIILRGPIHLGVATQTDRGLLVPVIKDADRATARAIAEAVAAYSEAGEAGTLQPSQLTGSTFTINNYGVFGVDGSAAIINYPEAGILGIGRIIERPWVVGSELTSRTICPLTLAFDHRVCDGATAGGFLRFVADCIESPTNALAEI